MSSSLDATVPPFNATEAGASFLSTSCLDFLMIELVPLAQRVTQQLDSSPSSSTPAPNPAPAPNTSASTTPNVGTVQSPPPTTPTTVTEPATTTTTAATAKKLDEDEERDAVHRRLEGMGYRVGQGLVERFSRDRPRFNDTLDVIKFLCKDIWGLVFGKQVDNLKTNHRGVYVLTDNHFRPISRMSTEPGGQAVVRAKPFLCYPAGIVRGALAALGITATVTAETTELPAAVFHIKTTPAKS